MTTSESPTHPDAPRAGGETPDLLSRLRRTIARRYTHSRAHGYEPTRVSVSLADMESAIAELAELRASLLGRPAPSGDRELPDTLRRFGRAAKRRGVTSDLNEDALWFAELHAFLDMAAIEIESLRAALLERHRDGERDYEAKFSELAALPENWDSYGGNRIWPEAIEAARRILSVLARPADVVPTTYGGIQLEWYRQGVAVEVRITPEGSIEYADAELYTLPATPPAASEPTEGASSD